jgi:hypothetical protein
MPPRAMPPHPPWVHRPVCCYCGQDALWLCENYCTQPAAFGAAPTSPPNPCSCGSTIWLCGYCGNAVCAGPLRSRIVG